MKNKKLKLLILMIPIMLMFTGCMSTDPITTDPQGLWATIVYYLAEAIIYFGKLFGNNIGWGIVITTVIFRLLMIPFYRAQLKSTEGMQKIQPEIKKIQEKYKGKNDQESKMKLNQEMQAMYKRNNVNPLAGCLPALLQMPILFLYYDAVQGLLINGQYSGIDPATGLANLGAGDMSQMFLGMDLSSRVIILAVIAAATTYLSTKISMLGNDSGNESANNMMKPMLIVMPIMILLMGLSLPGALALYWTIGNIMMIGQTLFFKKHIIFDSNKKKLN